MRDLVIISTVLALLTGIAALYLGWRYGDWKELRFEFAGVVLAILGGSWLLALIIVGDELTSICRDGEALCTARLLYTIVRNGAFFCFHISAARHAVAEKKRRHG